MRIGILTFHDALNCGAVLQAFALQEYLKLHGHSVEFIDYSCRPPFTIRRIIGRTVPNTISKIRDYIIATIYGHDKTYNGVLNISKKKYNDRTLEDTNDDYDIFIVGSDQVWNFRQSLSPAYLLDFVHRDKKKIAYAVSMGQCNVDADLHDELKDKLRTFDRISCRELKAVSFINNLFCLHDVATQCVDPTLLLPETCYKSISVNPDIKRYIVSYILNSLDSRQLKMIKDYCEHDGITLLNLRNPDTCVKLDFTKNIVVNPYEWLGYIQNAESVICGSFHATVFSLIFHKRFVVIESEDVHSSGGNQRVRSLLRPLGLEDRCICHEEIGSVINKPIDWEYIEKKLDSIRGESMKFLDETISI